MESRSEVARMDMIAKAITEAINIYSPMFLTKKLTRKMKSRIAIIERAGYVFRKLFLR